MRLFYVAKVGEELAETVPQRKTLMFSVRVLCCQRRISGPRVDRRRIHGARTDEMLRTLGKTEYLVIDDACHRLCLAALKTTTADV